MIWQCSIQVPVGTKSTSQQVTRRGGRTRIVASEKTKATQEQIHMLAWCHRPERLLVGPLALNVVARFRIPKTGPNRTKKPGDLYYGGRRYDRSNILKLVDDALEGVAYKDDSEIAFGWCKKIWDTTEGFTFYAEEL